MKMVRWDVGEGRGGLGGEVGRVEEEGCGRVGGRGGWGRYPLPTAYKKYHESKLS